jgi:hypothetical protein
MNLQTTLTSFLLAFTLLFFGCSSDSNESSKTENTSLNDTNSIKAFSNEKVEYKASGGVAYSWRQLSGTTVVLINPNTDTLSFIAPEVTQEESLVFELEIVKNKKDTTTFKQEIRVIVLPAKSTSNTDTTTGQTSTPTKDTNTTSETNSTDTNETNTSTTGDSSQTQGTDTNTSKTNFIKSLKLTLEKNSLNVDENITLKVVATYQDNTSKDVTEDVEWILSNTNAVQITNKTLHTKKDINIFIQAKLNNKTSNTLALEIYKEINGHRLPPEPDPIVNNSTLLGIDVNNNGVRDDVERWVYTYYSKPIEHAVFMQSARAYQIVIQEPEKALETMKYLDDVSDCESYWKLRAKRKGESFWLERYKDYDKEMNPIQFNTADRFLAYKKYNQTLSGGVYSSSPMKEWKSKCDFNVTKMLEME